jgi:hypothetical protein
MLYEQSERLQSYVTDLVKIFHLMYVEAEAAGEGAEEGGDLVLAVLLEDVPAFARHLFDEVRRATGEASLSISDRWLDLAVSSSNSSNSISYSRSSSSSGSDSRNSSSNGSCCCSSAYECVFTLLNLVL